MSLEELRKDWRELEGGPSNDIWLNTPEIKAIIDSKYRIQFLKALLLEGLILAVHFYFTVLVFFRFDELEDKNLEVLGVVSIFCLLGLFFYRLLKLITIYISNHSRQTHYEAIQKMAVQQIRIQRFYLLNIILGFALTIALVVLTVKIYNEYDITESGVFWGITLPLSLLFIFFFNRWIKRYYQEAIQKAEEWLKELEQLN